MYCIYDVDDMSTGKLGVQEDCFSIVAVYEVLLITHWKGYSIQGILIMK